MLMAEWDALRKDDDDDDLVKWVDIEEDDEALASVIYEYHESKLEVKFSNNTFIHERTHWEDLDKIHEAIVGKDRRRLWDL